MRVMREFIYFSRHARTSGNFSDLMKAGRLDIACHVVIAAFFLSHELRKDVRLHLVFYGQPDPPKHLEMWPGKTAGQTAKNGKETVEISKKDIGNLIKKMLYKSKKGKKIEVWDGFYIEKKSLLDVIDELRNRGKSIYILDKNGEDIRRMSIEKNPVFLLGDQEGLPKKELKRLKKISKTISIGPKTCFASQAVTIVNNELDRTN